LVLKSFLIQIVETNAISRTLNDRREQRERNYFLRKIMRIDNLFGCQLRLDAIVHFYKHNILKLERIGAMHRVRANNRDISLRS